jgi:hypothetical protein
LITLDRFVFLIVYFHQSTILGSKLTIIIDVKPEAAPPRVKLVTPCATDWPCPSTIDKNPMKRMKAPRQVSGVEWPIQNLMILFLDFKFKITWNVNFGTRFWRESSESRTDENAADERGDSTDGVNISAARVIAVPNCWRKFERFRRVQKPTV